MSFCQGFNRALWGFIGFLYRGSQTGPDECNILWVPAVASGFALLISDGFGIWVSGLHGLKDEAVWSFKVWGFRVVYDCKAALAAIYTVYTYVYIYMYMYISIYTSLSLYLSM